MGLLVLLGLMIVRGFDGSPGDGASPGEPSAPVDCPAEVSRHLPGAGGPASLVASYTTAKHRITICRDAAGQAYYDGRVLGAATTPDNHISLRATGTATGFIAVNGDYTYEIEREEVIVSQGGRLLSRMALTRTAP